VTKPTSRILDTVANSSFTIGIAAFPV